MLRVNFLEPFLVPLRSVRRLLEALGLLMALPMLLYGTLLGGGAALGAAVLGIIGRLDWVGEHPGACAAAFIGVELLVALPFTLLLYGYIMRVTREAAGGSRRLPACDRWGEMLLDGLKLLVLCLVWLGLPAGLLVLAWLGLDLGRPYSLEPSTLRGLALGTLWPVMTIWLGMGSLFWVACLRLAVRRSLVSAFNLRGVARDLRRGWVDYLLCFLIQMVPSLLMNLIPLMIGSTLFLLPLALVLGLPVMCYGMLVMAGLQGQYYRAYMTDPVPPPVRTPKALVAITFLIFVSLGFLASLPVVLLPTTWSIPTRLLCSWDVWRDHHSVKPVPSPYSELDKWALGAPEDVEKDPTALTRYLVQSAHQDRDRVRVIYRWIADRIAYDPYRPESSPTDVLRNRRSNAEGYARLFQTLAREAGLKSELVTGFAVPEAFTDNGPEPHHTWNSVQVEGAWQLVDSAWGAGQVRDRIFVKDFCEYYFLPAPEQLIFTHFPDDPRWQLLDHPLSREEFDRRPRWGPGFAPAGLSIVSPRTHQIEGVAKVVLEGPPDLYLQASMDVGQAHYPVLISRQGRRYTVEASIPRAGSGCLNLFAARIPDDHLRWAVSYDVSSTRLNGTFPESSQAFLEEQVELVCPLEGNLDSSKSTYSFQLKIPGASEAFVECQGRTFQLHRDGDRFQGEVPLKPGNAVVYARFSLKPESLLRYLVQ